MVVVDTDVVILPPSSRLDSKGSTKPGKKGSDYERIGNVFFHIALWTFLVPKAVI